MENVKKNAKKWCCIAIIAMLISMIGASYIQTNGGKVTVKEVKWETTQGFEMSGLLFIPDSATAENKAPAIVTSHGMYNNKEMQDANFVELARRGYVVLAQDMPSHGNSGNVSDIGTITTGLYESVKYLVTLNCVDTEQIGITGHSLGGMSSNVAISLDNMAEKPLISAVLLNCADATYKDADGNYTDVYGTRAAGIVAAQYDEFFMVDTDADGNETSPRDYVQNKNAQSFLYGGTDPSGKEIRQADTIYENDVDGTQAVRVIYNPAITHPWSHFSKRATTGVIDFFQNVFKAPNPINADNQVWQYKEAFNLLGLIAVGMFAVSLAVLLVFTKPFEELRANEPVQPVKADKKTTGWFFGSLIAGALFGTIAYLPIMMNAKTFTVFKDPWAQSESWGIGLWACACGLFAILSMVVSYYCNGKKNGVDLKALGVVMPVKKLVKTIVLALIVVCAVFGCVFFADYFFKTDFRIWTLALKAFEKDKIAICLFPYLPLILVYYIANSVAVNSFNYNDIGKKKWVNTAIIAVFSALPAVILLLIQYVKFFNTGFMTWPESNMQIVWLFPFLVVLPAAVVISRKIYRATRNPYIAGIINGVIVAIMTCSNTLTWK
mgnify:FL=1